MKKGSRSEHMAAQFKLRHKKWVSDTTAKIKKANQLKKMGVSHHEIAIAIGVPIDSPIIVNLN